MDAAGGAILGLTGYSRFLAEAARSRVPLEVSLELTHRCNFRCAHCYVPDFESPDLLSTERLLSLLEELAGIGTLFLTLTGGEVLLRRDWVIVARRARELGFCLTVMTNGSLIDEAATVLVSSLPARVEVSVYSVDEEVMDGITGHPGSCRTAVRAVELLRGRGVEVVVKTPVMTLNQRAVVAVGDWAAAVGAAFMAFPTIVSRKDGDPAPLAFRLPASGMRDFYSGPLFDCGEARALEEADPDGPLCAAGSRFCNITASGDVLACNILPGSAGNVRERSFREIWEQSPWLEKVRAIRRTDLHTCVECPERLSCGRCHAVALVEHGDILGPSAVACERAGILSEVRTARVEADASNRGPSGESPEDHRESRRPVAEEE